MLFNNIKKLELHIGYFWRQQNESKWSFTDADLEAFNMIFPFEMLQSSLFQCVSERDIVSVSV